MPKVSVIIPVYNVEKYLRQCLDSVVNQTLKDIEIICIDDRSTDNSLAILREYAQNDTRFVIIQQETNQGQGIARNKGLGIAKGEYIGFVDPDDWVELNMYEDLYNLATEHNADFVQCDYNRYFEESGDYKPVTALRPFKRTYRNVQANKIFTYHDFREECFLGLWNLVWTRLYKKSLIDKNNSRFSEGKYGEDKAFSIECKLSAERIYYTDKILYNYRVRANSSCHKEPLNVSYLLEEVKKVLHKLGKEKELKDIYGKFVIYLYGEDYKTLKKSERKSYVIKLKTTLSKKQYKLFNKTIVKKLKRKEFFENIFSIKNDKYSGCKKIRLFGIDFYSKGKKNVKTNTKDNLYHIPVAFSSDDNYIPHLFSAIFSVLENRADNDFIEFYILNDGLKKKNIELLEQINKQPNCSLSLVKVDKNLFSELPMTKECAHISIAAYYRFLLADLFPDLEKMIYLDSDLNVMTSLKELYNTDLSEHYIAAIEDRLGESNAQRLGIQKYINSGVLCINLNKWRADNIKNKFFEYAENNREKIVWIDQDVINAVLKDGIKLLDKKWNAQVGEYIGCYNDIGRKAYIVHHIGAKKPWLLKSKSPFKGVYFKYLENTPFRNYKIKTYIIQFLEEILSVKKTSAHIILSVLGIKLSIRIGKK